MALRRLRKRFRIVKNLSRTATQIYKLQTRNSTINLNGCRIKTKIIRIIIPTPSEITPRERVLVGVNYHTRIA